MFKSSSLFVLAIILLVAISFSNAEITGVTQEGKKLTITFLPSVMLWFENHLVLNGLKTNIKPYCVAKYGFSPLVCNLPTVPACDTIRLYGTPGIGTVNLQMLYSFNCTVVA
ncbi:hypothetical protein DFA_10539 [Cavenderia fasciculata]|uniref:Transmembrane protein n=1 Tax=Cavenderia fasciculata TaxID=261658 RepID=F4QAH8_CACFS|nr:uncharacterized protein DFA_10539 [Cavenderia fasciculata]EGG15697.1 hypothetical protein DFA_10539 [Cavenderia fasciculata]|eukprot:XP_004354439.1 hypothetical protein DFA_10539 [Cavenderia fasciculata]